MSSDPATTTLESALQRIDKRTSSRWMLFGVVFFSFLAGMRIDNGITRLLQAKAEYRWIADFAMGFLLLVIAVRWAVPLLARAKQADPF